MKGKEKQATTAERKDEGKQKKRGRTSHACGQRHRRIQDKGDRKRGKETERDGIKRKKEKRRKEKSKGEGDSGGEGEGEQTMGKGRV